MRIHRVEFTGFGPFRDRQVVDFDAFADDGLFLIAGKTGSGKSTVLDAVAFGLYGAAPRYQNTAVPDQGYRSAYASAETDTEVLVEFSVAEGRYLVRRSPTYRAPKRRGPGTTERKGDAQLARRTQDGWEGIAAGPRRVAEALGPLLQLTREQFLQVVLLAQNQFQEFLIARTDDRRQVLRKLFRAERFEDYETELLARRKELGHQLQSHLATAALHGTQLAECAEVEPFPWPLLTETGAADATPKEAVAWATTALEQQRTRVATAKSQLADASRAARAARAHLGAEQAIAERQKRIAQARAAQVKVEAMRHPADQWTLALAAAQRAQFVWPALTNERQAAARLSTATDALEEAGNTYDWLVGLSRTADPEVLLPESTADRAVLTECQLALVALQGASERPLQAERTLPGLAEAATAAGRALATHDQQQQSVRDMVASLQARQTAAAEAAAVIEPTANQLTLAQERELLARKALEAAHAADRARNDLRARLSEAADAASAEVQARAEVTELTRRRFAEYAGTLAENLQPGQPCLVCGSVEHPDPAQSSPAAVTEAALDLALTAAETAATAAEQARAAVTRTSAEVAELEARAEGRTVAEATMAQTTAREALGTAQAATEELARLRVELGELHEVLEKHASALATGAEERAALVAQATSTQQAQAGALAEVAAAKGGFATVADRVAAITARAEALVDLLTARQEYETALAAGQDAATQLATAVRDQGFDSVSEAAEARLENGDLTDLTTRLREYQELQIGTAALLADPNLQDLPSNLVDIEAAEHALTKAEQREASALQEHSDATSREATCARHAHAIAEAVGEAISLRDQAAVLDRLAATVHGEPPNNSNMRLVDFVLAAELEEVTAAANSRLGGMTGDRYRLVQDDDTSVRGKSGLGLRVLDHFTGEKRTTESLSGGERFLASLALALGLAETVSNRAGGISLDTLFIDEGFGSLDSETLESAMRTLDELRAGGRIVGVISHVEAMHEQIPAQLRVRRTPGGWSTID